MRGRSLVVAALCACALAPGTASAATTVSCPFANGATGDRVDRGFYVTNYPGSNVDGVTLRYLVSTAGSYSVTLTARSGTYDGPLIGTRTISRSFPVGGTLVTFPFGGLPVAAGSTITFAQTFDGPASLHYDTGVEPCPNVFETDGTVPPLDTFRGNSVGLTITALGYSTQGKKLVVEVGEPGTVAVTQAPTGRYASAAKKNKKLLRPSTATGGPPTITVGLRLTGTAKSRLRTKGKLKLKSAITFTPEGAPAVTQTGTLKIKRKKKG